MTREHDDYDVGEVLTVVSTWTVGLGIVVMVLFPFALPFLILTLVFAAPMVLLALPVAAVAAIWLGTRALLRRLGSGRPSADTERPVSPAKRSELHARELLRE
jgi:hypothetical protein